MPINVAVIDTKIRKALERAVNATASAAFAQAQKDVPVRKVFRYGRTPRTNARVQGRQETRTLSMKEALAEEGVRARLGLPSAFNETNASGRRLAGSRPIVQTTLFPGNYRSRDRANPSSDRGMERRAVSNLGTSTHYLVNYRTSVHGGQIAEPDRVRESDLSARGRYELKRRKQMTTSATGKVTRSAIHEGLGGKTLGGALRDSLHNEEAHGEDRKIRATIEAGNDEVTYAKYVEFGTRHARAQPFLRPALALARERLPIELETHLGALGTG